MYKCMILTVGFFGDDEILLYSQPYLLMDWYMVFYTINFVQNRPVLFVYGRIRECFLWGESVLTSVSGIRNSERLSDQLKRSFNSYHATPCHSLYFILAKMNLISLFSIQRPIYAEKKMEEMAGEVFIREWDQYIAYSIHQIHIYLSTSSLYTLVSDSSASISLL